MLKEGPLSKKGVRVNVINISLLILLISVCIFISINIYNRAQGGPALQEVGERMNGFIYNIQYTIYICNIYYIIYNIKYIYNIAIIYDI